MPQRPADRVPELAALLLRRRVLDLAQLLEHLALLRRQLRGRPDMDADVQVAMAALTEPRQALGAQAVGHAGLGAGLDAQHRLTERRRHLDLRAQRGLREGDAEIVDQVVAVALEARVLFDVEYGDEIAARTVARPRDALPPHREIVVISHAGRHVDLNRLLALHSAVAIAAMTRVADDRALTRARGTRRYGEELAEERLRLVPNLAAAAAGGAPRWLRARFGAGACALGARLETLDPYRLGGAGGDFGERELQSDLDVVPAAPIAHLAAAKETFKTSATAQPKVPHEDRKSFGEIEVHRVEAAGTTRPLMTKAVIGRALLRISQHLVRLGNELEFLFGGFVAVVAVGVALHRELAVGLLDVRFARIPLHTEDDVEILLHAIRATPPRAATCGSRARRSCRTPCGSAPARR